MKRDEMAATAIEHWTIVVCRDCGGRLHPDNTGHRVYCRAPNVLNTESIEVVRADAYRAAVSEIETLRGKPEHPGDVGRDYENLHDWS
jgi:hypothetical protein